MSRRHLVAVSAFVATCAAASSASAQPTEPGYASNNFEPSERGSDWFANESLDFRGPFRFALGVVGDYGYRGIIASYHDDGRVHESVVRDQLFAHAGASFTLWDRVRLGLSLPFALYEFGHTADVNGVTYPGPAHQQSVGDLRISLDVRLFGVYGDPFTIAAGMSVFAPTGERDDYDGDGAPRFAPRLLFAGDIGSFAYAARAGYQWRDLQTNYIDTRVGSTFQFSGAAGVRFFDKKLLIGPEVFGQTMINSHAFKDRATPIEAILGVHVNIADQVRLNGGFGTFLDKGYGAPVYRALFGIEWAPGYQEPDRDSDAIPDSEDACPDVPGVRTNDPKTNGCPSDRDGDGIRDSVDACPDVAGVATNDPKTNGCPPPPADRDGDGIPDSEDACPAVPGVHTDDPKTNGCPSDRDKDTILDSEDACPDSPGPRTLDPRTNGCPPDTDRDKDGVPNDVDACPDEAGPKTEDPKTSGCPRVFIKNSQIQILEQPKFDVNKAVIKPESDSLLYEVARMMNAHPEIRHVRVEGHTDSTGSDAYNKKLSGQRAQAVVKWLVTHSVAPDRLTALGMGKDHPVVPNDTDANRALNRRVEFHIEEQDTTSKEVVKTRNGATVEAPPAPKPAP